MAELLLQRDTELAALDRRLAEVRAGGGRVIIVDGPAGIGKSSLLSAVARTAAGTGMRVLRAWGSPLEQDAGWGVARQLFAPLQGPEWDALAVGAAALARLALEATPDGAASAGPGGDTMHAATHGLTWLTNGLAERAPTLIIIDDVHWADAPSLRWLAGLARQLGELPVGILCAVRSGEPPAQPGLLAELLAAAPEAPVRPTPLGPAAVRAVVARRLPAAGPGFASACHAASAGNPFLLGALLSHVLAENIEPTEQVAAGLSAYGPEQVGRTVERQLSRLPAGATELARAFAVLGRRAPLRQARELAGLTPEQATDLADRLCLAGLLSSDAGEYSLVHPLVARALYRGMAEGERGLWHARAARLLADERADAETVALHLLHTQPARDAGIVARLRAAAERASLRGAPQSSAVLLRRALAEPPPDRSVEAEVCAELGLALAAHVQPEAPRHLLKAVDLAEAPEQRSRLALAGARALGLLGLFADAVTLCRYGLDGRDGVPASRLTRLEVELVANLALSSSTVDEARAVRRGASAGADRLWRVFDAWQAVCDAEPVSVPQALLAEAFSGGGLAEESDSILGTWATFTLLFCGLVDQATAQGTALIEVARPRGWRIALAHGSFLRAFALVRAGQVRDAEADARFSFDSKAVNSPSPALLWSVAPLVEALTELDELADADAVLARVGLLADPPAGALATPMLLERRARLRLAEHRPADAHADLVAAARWWDAFGIAHPGLAAWRVDDSEALVALDDLPAARRLAEEHGDLARRVGLPGPRGAGLRALARTAPPKQAIDLLEEAVGVLADTPERLEYARVLVDLGAALRRGNRRDAAKDPLRRALALTDRGGMRLLARRARQELTAAGARPRRDALIGIQALTSAEHRVAVLAAQGLSNPEIAQQLYVTRRTVETHLTHAFAKLGVTSRAELKAHLVAQP